MRDYTRAELEKKLAPLAAEPADIQRVLEDLAKGGWQSDDRFARSFGRQKAPKQGSALIAQAMRQKGLSDELIRSAVAELAQTDLQRAQTVWQKKFGALAQTPQMRARQARFLLSRGFSGEVVSQVVGGRELDLED
jgi:regulatory protein